MSESLPERSGFQAPADIAALRAGAAAALEAGRWATVRPVETILLGGCEVLRIAPQGDLRGRVLHFHGGGYRIGMPEMDAPFAEALADACGVEVLLPRYRLAPESPFPAAVNDACAVLLALVDDLPVIVSGASAGGGLAAGLGAGHGDRLAGLVLHSAWLDLRVSAQSYAANAATDVLFSESSAARAAELYLQGHDPAEPLASPLLADTARFPAALITVGSGEVLFDDSRAMSARLGSRAVLHEIEGMEHVAVTRDRAGVGAAEVFAATCAFIDERLNAQS